MSIGLENTMTAVQLTTSNGQLEVIQAPIPHAGRGEIRLRVKYAGMCHTDIHFIDGELAPRMPERVILGHEVAGEVDEVGEGVAGWVNGDRVLLHPVGIVDGQTSIVGVHYDGGWAQYVVAPSERALHISPDLAYDQAAIIADAVATPWAAITETAQVRPAESVAVWGLGGLGYHAVQLLRLVGAAPVIGIDPSPAARERALRAGADIVLDPNNADFVEQLSAARPLDVAFDFVGHAAVQQQAFDAVGPRGRVVLVGIPDAPVTLNDSATMIRLQKRVLGHYGSERRHTEELVSLAAHGRLDLGESISEVLPLDQVKMGLDHLRNQVGNPIRIVLKP
ncbi:zinc-binding dehydrogenase [Microbacterium sp. A94]|uniref:zinc-binding dehydrogenase n=1 Tax=Microbacterium sp. A94 TaxID=3450717 RepID=UPI003F41DACA